jgi:hypothetical protein
MARSSDGGLLLRSRGRGTDHSQTSSAPVLHPREYQRLSPLNGPLFIVVDRRERSAVTVSIESLHSQPASTKLAQLGCRPKWSGILFRRMSLIDPKLPSPNPRKLRQGSHQFIAWLLYKATVGQKRSPLVGPIVPQPQSTQQPQQYARSGRGKRGLAIGKHRCRSKLRT